LIITVIADIYLRGRDYTIEWKKTPDGEVETKETKMPEHIDSMRHSCPSSEVVNDIIIQMGTNGWRVCALWNNPRPDTKSLLHKIVFQRDQL